ncbi:hypothetical protein NE237_028370 [Protea cynaroides]|uniref:peroxidase n=1 Tax=Protea cynaroides TaxID=273540 RepID=A0A9Q0GPS2_9MAGN|nr:hypothetical protein NE237_028370 [Protea cynaroides]
MVVHLWLKEKGCDASILLDGNRTEKHAAPNLTAKGFNAIDKMKSDVEAECHGVVSCADIIIMAARDVFVSVGYYTGMCSANSSAGVEDIVKQIIDQKYQSDVTIVPALIRMQFHDCFVRGCDASLLLDGTDAEKTAIPNLSVRGFDVIDAAKSALESQCGTGIVSCADIIIMAAREAVALGGGYYYDVQTGRMDGLISNATEALLELPTPEIPVADSTTVFGNLGLSVTDMVALLGAHTVGVAECFTFQDRLYNFSGTGMADPTMNSALVNSLKSTCPQNSNVDNTTSLDQGTAFTIDNSYFNQIMENNGILGIDQEINLDTTTNTTVASFAADNNLFNAQFAAAMFKLGAVNVLLPPSGEIRLSCFSALRSSFCYIEFTVEILVAGFFDGLGRGCEVGTLTLLLVCNGSFLTPVMAEDKVDLIALKFFGGIKVRNVVIKEETVGVAEKAGKCFNFGGPLIPKCARVSVNFMAGGSVKQHLLINNALVKKKGKKIKIKKYSDQGNIANLDQNIVNANTFDNFYFKQIPKQKGILGIDQEIDLDTRTNATVASFASNDSVFLSNLLLLWMLEESSV